MTIFKNWWSVSTAAQELGVNPQTVRALIHNGTIDSVLMGSGYLISQQEIDRFIESRKNQTAKSGRKPKVKKRRK